MQNVVTNGNILTFVAPSGGVTGGTPVLLGSLLVIPVSTVAAGLTAGGSTRGEFSALPKKTTDDMSTYGTKAYWDNTNKYLTTTSTSNTFVGYSTDTTAGTSATTVQAYLHGAPA